MEARLRRIREAEEGVRRTDRRHQFREIQKYTAQESRSATAAALLQVGALQRLRERRQGRPQGEPRSRVEAHEKPSLTRSTGHFPRERAETRTGVSPSGRP